MYHKCEERKCSQAIPVRVRNDVIVHVIPKIGRARETPQAAQAPAVDRHSGIELLLFLGGVKSIEHIPGQVFKMPSMYVSKILQELRNNIFNTNDRLIL